MRHRRGGRASGGQRGPADDPSARERAREVLHAALARGDDPEHAAKAALAVTRECAEAWLLLADFAASREEARDLVRRAVEAATHALGSAGLAEGRGRLGETADGAAYLQALAASARHQAASGRVEQAVQSFFGLLAMDPRDPVPVRGDLLLLLLAEGRDDEAEEIVARFPEEASADWMLGRALVRFRRAEADDAKERATAALARAVRAFPAAARSIVEGAPAGSSSTAADPLLARAFASTDGASEWLRATLASTTPVPAARPEPGEGRAPAPAVHGADADRRFNAREIVEAARETTEDRREALAKRAIEVWPDCADAWRLLASWAVPGAERVRLLREAVSAAARALGRSPAADPSPPSLPMWDESEDARAYLEAHAALCDALRAAGADEEALAEERRLLGEDPDDVLGRAGAVAARLLAAGRDEDAREWLSRHERDVMPVWVWLRVLARLRGEERAAATVALAEAMTVAPLVAPLLHGRFAGFGDPEHGSRDAWEQARGAAEALRPAFAATPGALDWLRERLPAPASVRSRSSPGRRRERT